MADGAARLRAVVGVDAGEPRLVHGGRHDDVERPQQRLTDLPRRGGHASRDGPPPAPPVGLPHPDVLQVTQGDGLVHPVDAVDVRRGGVPGPAPVARADPQVAGDERADVLLELQVEHDSLGSVDVPQHRVVLEVVDHLHHPDVAGVDVAGAQLVVRAEEVAALHQQAVQRLAVDGDGPVARHLHAR